MWIIGERVAQMVLSLVIGVLTARYLGPNNYGTLNYTASYVTFFTAIATLGMEGVVIKKMIAAPDKEGEYLGGCMVLRLISSVLCSISIVLIVFCLDMDDSLKVFLSFLQSLQLVFQTMNLLDCWFQRYLKSKYISIGKIIAFSTVMAYKLILILTSARVEWFAFANSISALIIAALLYVFYRRAGGPPMKVNIKLGFDVLKDSYHYILSGLMVALYSQMDKIMIGKMLTDEAVGLYTVALAICGMWVFVPTALIQSFRPDIMELREAGNMKAYHRRLRQLYSMVIWMCVGVSLVICVAAPLVITVLYGEEYRGAVGSLQIAVWFETFSMIGTARGIWILCENKNRFVKYYLAIGSVVNVALNAVMIPIFGIEGAAIATLITQIVTSLVAPMLFKETREHTKIVWEAFICKWYFDSRKKGDGT